MGVRIIRAVVTGAPSGIGRAFARRLGIDGASAVLAGPDRARLQAVADEISASGSGAGLAVADLADEAPLRTVGRRMRSSTCSSMPREWPTSASSRSSITTGQSVMCESTSSP